MLVVITGPNRKSEMAKKYYAGAWQCHDCTHGPIDGMVTRCPNPICKQPRNATLTPEEQTWLPTAPRLLTDPDEIAKVAAGPAWNCGHDGEFNWGNVNKCVECGRPKSSDDTVNRRRRFTRSKHNKGRTNVRDEVHEWDIDKARRVVKGDDAPRVTEEWEQSVDEIPRDRQDIDDIIREDTVEYPGLEEKPVDTAPPIVQKIRHYRRAILIGGTVAAVILLSILGISLARDFTATVPGTVTVTSLNWQRSVEVLEYRTFYLDGWDPPDDARITDQDWRWVKDEPIYADVDVPTKIPRTTTVKVPYDCSTYEDPGNGNWIKDEQTCTSSEPEVYYEDGWTKERQVVGHKPINDWYYHYQVDRWETARWEHDRGTENDTPSWPEPNVRDNRPGDWVGDQRTGDRVETYIATFTDNRGQTHTKEVNRVDWQEITIGEELDAWYNKRSGNFSSVDWSSAVDIVPGR